MKKIVIFFFGCAIAFPLFLSLSYLSLPLASPALQHYYTIKDYINTQAPKDKKRLVIMSASDGMFGIVGEMIDNQTKYFPINYSMFFGTGLDIEFRINRLISILKNGDTLLLPLNYGFYTTQQNNQYFSYYQNMLSWGDKEFFKNHPLLTLKTLLKSPPSKIPYGLLIHLKAKLQGINILQNMKAKWANPPQTFEGVLSTSLDSYGELSQHQGTLLDLNATNPYIKEDFKPSLYFLSQFKKLVDFCNKHSIRIIVTYSPMLQNPKFNLDNPSDLSRIEKFKQELSKHNIYIVGNPQNFQYPIQDFYDTTEHLNTQGAKKYTQELIKILNQSEL